ncbi:MAG: haloacid dehalogenase-like hydrolase [Myxococcota bacterium]
MTSIDLHGNWDTFNRVRLERLIAHVRDKGAASYAVVDCDNTSLFGDVQDATFFQQLGTLAFAMDPDELYSTLTKGVPGEPMGVNADGQPVTIKDLARDIHDDYVWLYGAYEGLGGTRSLDEVRAQARYKDFVAKMRYTYDALCEAFEPMVGYQWIIYMFSGMTAEQVRRLTESAVRAQLRRPVRKLTWTSPAELEGCAGRIRVTFQDGLRTVPEMQRLYASLRCVGVEVFMCSASFVDVVRELATNDAFGYGFDEEHVIAMELERDEAGRILPEYRKGWVPTQRAGKSENIRRLLVSRFGHGPILVAGDSDGDAWMLREFEDTRCGLIFNRVHGGAIGELCARAVDARDDLDARYVLQGRDEHTGALLPCPHTVLHGAKRRVLLHDDGARLEKV